MGRLITGSDALTQEEVQALIDAQIEAGASDWPAITNKPTTLAGYGIADAVRFSPSPLRPAAGTAFQTTMFGSSGNPGAASGAPNGFDLYPWCPSYDCAVTALTIRVNGAGATLAKVVVYSADATGAPDALIFEGGDVDCSTTGGKATSFTYTFVAGTVYWVGVRTSSTTATINTWSPSATPDIGVTPGATSARKILRRTLTYATAAPSSWGFTTSELNAAAPWAIWGNT